MRRSYNKLEQFGKTKSEVLQIYLAVLHTILSVHTHINIDSVLKYAFGSIKSEVLDEFFQLDNGHIITMIENTYIASV